MALHSYRRGKTDSLHEKGHACGCENLLFAAERSVFVFKYVVIVLNGTLFIRSDTQAQTGTDEERSIRQDDG